MWLVVFVIQTIYATMFLLSNAAFDHASTISSLLAIVVVTCTNLLFEQDN